MIAVAAARQSPDDPLAGLEVGERPAPDVPQGWARVRLRAASLNHHDLWSLRGVGLPADRLPMTLGCDGAGVDDDGNEVVVHAVISDPDWHGDETLDPRRSLLSEVHQGTLADEVVVPRRNLVAKPPSLTFEQAACLPTSWLTAYRMLFTRSGLAPGSTVLVQGAGGGVATAAIVLAKELGHTVFCTSREEDRRIRALALGADLAVESGERLPEKVDVALETVGAATWSHSLRALRPGGRIVVSGATSGPNPPADLNRVFFLQLSVVGSTMGTRSELIELLDLLDSSGVKPIIDQVRPLADARESFQRLAEGTAFGKLVLTV